MDKELQQLIEEKKALGIPETMDEIAKLANIIQLINNHDLSDINMDTGSLEPMGKDDEHRPLRKNKVYTEKEWEAYLDGKKRASDFNKELRSKADTIYGDRG